MLDDGIILRSEANLVASLRASWARTQRGALRAVLGRISAEERARTTREVRAALPENGSIDLATLAGLHEAELPYGAPSGPDGEIVLRCPEAAMFDLADALVQAGARAVSVRRIDYAFSAENPLSERLLARL